MSALIEVQCDQTGPFLVDNWKCEMANKKKAVGSTRIAGAPTRNFSGEAIRAAAKFRGLRTAQLATHIRKERAAAIKRAVISFYGLK